MTRTGLERRERTRSVALFFDSGDFSENETFLLTDFLEHLPPEVLAIRRRMLRLTPARSHTPLGKARTSRVRHLQDEAASMSA